MIWAISGTWQDQPRCGCGRAECSRWQDPHVRTPARRTSCAAVVESSPSMRWKISVAQNVICWRRLTGLFPSDTPGCDHSGWCGRGSTAWTLFCSWLAPLLPFRWMGTTWKVTRSENDKCFILAQRSTHKMQCSFVRGKDKSKKSIEENSYALFPMITMGTPCIPPALSQLVGGVQYSAAAVPLQWFAGVKGNC